MANVLQQRAQQRKLIYAGLIMALFTAALLHRNLINARAQELQLREVARGEVELTSSVMRIGMSGLHGVGVTFLWSAAIEKQRKHEWNELELLVNSITRLQPYFITPWRFQGWNLAFNVSVECDRPIDKYYYITRGLTLLANGERRNQGTVVEKGQLGFPGNPDLRRDIGIFYQLKIGTSDDKYTMRCLLDMSCIDPLERRFDMTGLSGNMPSQAVRDELTKFCRNHPTLSRRIVERILKNTPKQFIEFLDDNRDVPSRFDANKRQGTTTGRKDPYDQFPILPIPAGAEADQWPNPTREALTDEAVSVYLMSRTWFLYAQDPLPPPENWFDRVNDPSKRGPQKIDLTRYRPARMADVLFRSDPCRAQAFIAETLQEEGWFDGEGWLPPISFVPNVGRVGTAERYRSGPAWARAYQMYLNFGKETGLYLTEAQKIYMEDLAHKFRAQFSLREDQDFQGIRSDMEESPEYLAHSGLRLYKLRRGMTNYDSHLFGAEAEQTDEAVIGRKLYYQAEWARAEEKSLAKYFRLTEQANYVWLDLLLKHPRFAQVRANQEDTYERQLKFMTRSMTQPEVAVNYTDVILLGFELMQRQFPVGLPFAPQIFRMDRKWTESSPAARASELGMLGCSMDQGPLLAVGAVASAGTEEYPLAEVFGLPWASWIEPGSDPQNPKRFLPTADLDRLIPMRTTNPIRMGIRGPFDMIQYYDAPRLMHPRGTRSPGLKDAVCLWALGAGMPSGSPLEFFSAGLNPAHHLGLFTTSSLNVYKTYPPFPNAMPSEGWRWLIEPDSIMVVRSRLNIR